MQAGRNPRAARRALGRHLSWLLAGTAAAGAMWLGAGQPAQANLSFTATPQQPPSVGPPAATAPAPAAVILLDGALPATLAKADACRVRLLPPIPLTAARIRAFEGLLAPTEEHLLDDAADGQLDDHTLLRAALIASGATAPEQIARYERRMERLVEQLRAALAEQPRGAGQTRAPQGRAAELAAPQDITGPAFAPECLVAEAVLRFMHREILTGGYRLEHTDLRSALEEGRYNCVTATILYLILADAAGLKGCGLELPRHAMARLDFGTAGVDVETTCAEYFALGPEAGAVASLRIGPGGGIQPAGNRVPRGASLPEPPAPPAPPAQPPRLRTLGAAELAAMVYYNQGVDRLAEGQFAEAAAANAKALRLDPQSRTAYGNLLATINNWAVDYLLRGEYLEAIALLERGRALDPAYEPFTLNYVHVACQWSGALCGQGSFAEAAAVLCEAAERLAAQTRLAPALHEVFQRWAAARYQAGDLLGAWAVFDVARTELGATPEWLACEAAQIDGWVRRLLAQERFDEAAALCAQALRRLPGNSLLEADRRAALGGCGQMLPVSLGPLRRD